MTAMIPNFMFQKRALFVAVASISLVLFHLLHVDRSTAPKIRHYTPFNYDRPDRRESAIPTVSSSIGSDVGRFIDTGAFDISVLENRHQNYSHPEEGLPLDSKTVETRPSNRTIAQLQSRSLNEVSDSLRQRIDEIKVLRKDVRGKIVPAAGNDADGMKTAFLKSMNIDDDLIKDYFFDRVIDKEPDLEEWADVPSQLKKLSPVVFKVVPKKMDPAFKTPCWYRRSTLKCLPYFYILGMTKCGTSDLWNKTVLHPEIIGTPKEVHWWTKRFGNLQNQAGKFLSKYTERGIGGIDMPNRTAGVLKSRRVLGDGSPSTLWNNRYWRKIYPRSSEPPYINADVIARVTPGAKLIVILRDPVERLYSSYNFFQRTGRAASPAHFHDIAENSVKRFEDCLSRGSLRGCAYQPVLSKWPYTFPTDFTGGLYHVYLEDWMRLFPREQILILELTDWHENCEENLAKVYNHLELDSVSGDIVKKSCSQAKRVRPKKRPVKPMLNETRRYLERKYQPFNERLYELLQDDRFDWRYNKRRP